MAHAPRSQPGSRQLAEPHRGHGAHPGQALQDRQQ